MSTDYYLLLQKVFESIVGRWFLDIILPTIDPNQFGALRRRSTAFVSILHQWCSTLHAGGSVIPVRAVFVNFVKAFDRVNHNLLVTKFLPRCMECRRGLAMRKLSSVRPSVCPSNA